MYAPLEPMHEGVRDQIFHFRRAVLFFAVNFVLHQKQNCFCRPCELTVATFDCSQDSDAINCNDKLWNGSRL